MVTIKEATQSAISFARESLGPERTENLLLEEIESSIEDGVDVWRITLSMPDSHRGGFTNMLGRRDYKTFAVLKSTGEVLSMKIREMSQP
jgi:hypothetical protein